MRVHREYQLLKANGDTFTLTYYSFTTSFLFCKSFREAAPVESRLFLGSKNYIDQDRVKEHAGHEGQVKDQGDN